MTFIDRLDLLCKERHISKRKLEREAGLGNGSTAKWKDKNPNQTSLEKISNYFGVSVSYLIGESEFKTEKEAVIDGWNKRIVNDELKDEIRRIEAGVRIPVLGEVPCGIPIEAIELIDAEEWEEIPDRLARTGTFFGLIAKGDSMSPRIQAGDVLIVRQQSDAESGDVVIAKINGEEATCKRLLKQEGGIVLQPFNPAHSPMYFSNAEILKKPVRIIGKVVENRQKF